MRLMLIGIAAAAAIANASVPHGEGGSGIGSQVDMVLVGRTPARSVAVALAPAGLLVTAVSPPAGVAIALIGRTIIAVPTVLRPTILLIPARSR